MSLGSTNTRAEPHHNLLTATPTLTNLPGWGQISARLGAAECINMWCKQPDTLIFIGNFSLSRLTEGHDPTRSILYIYQVCGEWVLFSIQILAKCIPQSGTRYINLQIFGSLCVKDKYPVRRLSCLSQSPVKCKVSPHISAESGPATHRSDGAESFLSAEEYLVLIFWTVTLLQYPLLPWQT